MGIRCDDERTWDHVPAFHHDLVSNARSRRLPIYSLLLGERFNRAILLQVRFVLVLDVMIERERKLLRILHFLGANALELAHHRRSVVMRHAAVRTNGQKIPRAQRTCWPLGHMLLHDFFNDGLAHDELRYRRPFRVLSLRSRSSPSARLGVVDKSKPRLRVAR